MGRDKFTYEGLAPLEDRIRRLDEDAAYVMVWDRTDRSNEEQLGRFDLTLADALPYMEPPPRAVPEDDEPADPFDGDLDDYDEDDDEDDDEPEPEPWAADDDVPQVRRIAEAACCWVRDIARRNTVGEPWRRFRLKVYGPKGVKVVDSGTFICRNHDHDLDMPTPEEIAHLKIPPPTFEEAASVGAVRGIKALGDYYAQWGQIVLGSVGQLQGVNNAMLGRLHRQLQSSRDQVDQLVAAILENRYKELQLDEERQADERAGDARTALAREAIGQLGDAAKAFLTARGVSPEMADVLGVIGSSPELVGALNDPEVRALMREPDNLKGLAQMLKAAAEQARAVRQGAQPQGPPEGATDNASQPAAG